MQARVDTGALKRAHPVDAVIAGYGVDLHPSGRSLIGRCPFHGDGGRPNLHVYPDTQSWFCYRCRSGGDVITFIERMDGVGFREAVARLEGDHLCPISPRKPLVNQPGAPRGPTVSWGPEERACLAAAVELYHNRLLSEPAALAYVEGRGLDRRTIEDCRLGYAGGKELARYLRWRRLPSGAAMRAGLLGRGGRETMAGRVVVPEIRAGQPIWLVGRTIEPAGVRPKYLGLPGRKPLLGWEMAARERTVVVTEGVFDWLILRSWGYPALALVGTQVRPEVVQVLTGFERVYLVLDTDAAGQAAATRLAEALGDRAVVLTLPGVKDVAELALRPDGRTLFARAVERAVLARAA